MNLSEKAQSLLLSLQKTYESKFIDTVDGNCPYSVLEELQNVALITVRQVDFTWGLYEVIALPALPKKPYCLLPDGREGKAISVNKDATINVATKQFLGGKKPKGIITVPFAECNFKAYKAKQQKLAEGAFKKMEI